MTARLAASRLPALVSLCLLGLAAVAGAEAPPLQPSSAAVSTTAASTPDRALALTPAAAQAGAIVLITEVTGK